MKYYIDAELIEKGNYDRRWFLEHDSKHLYVRYYWENFIKENKSKFLNHSEHLIKFKIGDEDYIRLMPTLKEVTQEEWEEEVFLRAI